MLTKPGVDLPPLVADLASRKHANWAWRNFLPTVASMLHEGGYRSILEVGGGRSPSLSKDEISELSIKYTCNDISARELSLAPDWVEKALFDIQTPNTAELDAYTGAFDFVFSQMVMEHVPSFDRAYRNIYRILEEGGVGIAFHPTLYSVPFIANRLLPDTVTRKVLKLVFPNRTDTGTPKFPAYYSGCVISTKVTDHLKEIGFRNAWQVPFYWHNYYKKFPLVRDVHTKFSDMAADKDMTFFATFAYTIVRK
jgi:SAM-dependent methyltransferase